MAGSFLKKKILTGKKIKINKQNYPASKFLMNKISNSTECFYIHLNSIIPSMIFINRFWPFTRAFAPFVTFLMENKLFRRFIRNFDKAKS